MSVQVEDGYGLRPNISIRGVATERSGRITLLEDNVLIAPAPYSAPSAYYFPTIGRMQGIEVLKGPAAITQGPYTIGGALNMISTAVPDERAAQLQLEAGEDHTYRVHAAYGDRLDNGFGFLLETHQWRSDGFQDIDRSGRDTGLDVQDYTVKLAWAPADSRHLAELKLQYTSQDSNQSYLGLTDADFGTDPLRRYGLSALDNIDTEHTQVVARYQFRASDRLQFGLTAYNNTHERDWFKTEGIDVDGSASAESFSRTSWASVVTGINTGAGAGGASADALQAILDGADTAVGALQLRSNSREYFSRGLQGHLQWSLTTGTIGHDIELGVRYHEDEEDRLQRNSTYQQLGGQLLLSDFGLLGNAGNRVQEADAWAVHLNDTLRIGRWTLTPGLRFESIDQRRTRWETRLDRTSNPASRTDDNLRDTRRNHTTVWLPGLGISYAATEGLMLIAGVHEGFTAPSNAPGVRPEKAVNYEAGLRWQHATHNVEAMLFLSDYDNLLGECTASSGSNCVIGDAFNGDAATVRGLEFSASTDLTTLVGGEAGYRLPLRASYTYIDSEFDSDIADTDFFGDVSRGDPIPYIPSHQASLTVGWERQQARVYLSGNYVDAVCVRASCGLFERTDDALTVDLSGSVDINPALRVFARVENLFNSADILGRQPYGARPNKSRTASVGVRVDL